MKRFFTALFLTIGISSSAYFLTISTASNAQAQTQCLTPPKSDTEGAPWVLAHILNKNITEGIVTIQHPGAAELGVLSGVDSLLVTDDGFLPALKVNEPAYVRLIRRKGRIFISDITPCSVTKND